MNKNAAPHSGAVSWVRGLVERVEEPMSKLRNMNKVGFLQCLTNDLLHEVAAKGTALSREFSVELHIVVIVIYQYVII